MEISKILSELIENSKYQKGGNVTEAMAYQYGIVDAIDYLQNKNELTKALFGFLLWTLENNEKLYNCGHDVLGCVKAWQDEQMQKLFISNCPLTDCEINDGGVCVSKNISQCTEIPSQFN